MTSPLSGSLARVVGKALRGLFLDATYETVSAGTYDPLTDTFSGAGTVTYAVKAIAEGYPERLVAVKDALIRRSDRRVTILAASLPVSPRAGDKITLAGGQLLQVISVESDQARATWVLQAR
jgi:phosphoribosylamine-glycine ligase